MFSSNAWKRLMAGWRAADTQMTITSMGGAEEREVIWELARKEERVLMSCTISGRFGIGGGGVCAIFYICRGYEMV